MRRNSLVALLSAPLLIAAVSCASADTETTPNKSVGSPAVPNGLTGACAPDKLDLQEPGLLTVATDSPAYEPWFTDNDPTNGEGFESAVAYAVAEKLGFNQDQVTWVTVPFNNSYKPGEKSFDFDINQISITPARAEVVDFSDGYYSAAQAVIALDGEAVPDITSLDELKDLKLGAQTGTTSLLAITDVLQPSEEPLVYDDTNAAKQALLNGQVDAILADLPTAFYITSVEIEQAEVIGQFQPAVGSTEEFGMLFDKDSTLVPCVNEALALMETEGTLAAIEQEWLSDVVDVPVLD